jgi:hypothetical protein
MEVVMNGPGVSADRHEIVFEAYGVRMRVAATRPDVLELMKPLLPPGWEPCEPEDIQRHFGITAEPTGTYAFSKDGRINNKGLGLHLALSLLETELRLYVARKAPGAIFIHAGVVGHHGRTIVLPGASFAGKTTLVAALVRQGATYYSDEFAVLDDDGFVRPYAKPLSIRDDERHRIQVEHTVESLGGVAGDAPLRIGAIVVTNYRPDAEWRPRLLTPGEGAMALVANAVPARERPAEVMRAVKRSSEGALAIESERGEADVIAPLLLKELEQLAA